MAQESATVHDQQEPEAGTWLQERKLRLGHAPTRRESPAGGRPSPQAMAVGVGVRQGVEPMPGMAGKQALQRLRRPGDLHLGLQQGETLGWEARTLPGCSQRPLPRRSWHGETQRSRLWSSCRGQLGCMISVGGATLRAGRGRKKRAPPLVQASLAGTRAQDSPRPRPRRGVRRVEV